MPEIIRDASDRVSMSRDGKTGEARATLFRQFSSRWSLSGSFLIVAIIAVALAMIGLGALMTREVRTSVVRGFATTAANTVGTLIAHQLSPMLANGPLTPEVVRSVGNVLEMAGEAEHARLLSIGIYDQTGALVYRSSVGLQTEFNQNALDQALSGNTFAELIDIPIDSIGDLPISPITVLSVYAPLYRPGTQQELGVAEMYFSAGTLIAVESESRRNVWLVVAGIGLALLLALFIFVDRASATIDRQRQSLAANLERTTHLADEISRLHAASEHLRVTANLANEDLLNRVGTDLHDGPLQLLTLLVLRLTNPAARKGNLSAGKTTNQNDAVSLAAGTIEELRNISAGLVLPELEGRSLRETILMAVERHRALTATTVDTVLELGEDQASKEIKICAYRVVQEGLANAYRHGGGADQSVAADLEGHTLRISVRNGISAEKPERPARGTAAGLGLRGMRLRVESLGGTLGFEIDEQRGHASVEVTIPFAAPR